MQIMMVDPTPARRDPDRCRVYQHYKKLSADLFLTIMQVIWIIMQGMSIINAIRIMCIIYIIYIICISPFGAHPWAGAWRRVHGRGLVRERGGSSGEGWTRLVRERGRVGGRWGGGGGGGGVGG